MFNNSSIDSIIEINRNGSLFNFEKLFDILGDDAWGIAIAGTKKERMEYYDGRYEKANDEVREEVLRMVEDLFDLQKVVASMPEDIAEEILDKWSSMVYERKYGKKED